MNNNKIILIPILFLIVVAMITVVTGALTGVFSKLESDVRRPSFVDGKIKTFTVIGAPFSFTPNVIEANRGERIRIVFVNKQGLHDWVLDEFNVRTPQIKAGEEARVEFTADRAGTFEYYCSVGNHRAMGMVGKLIVK